MTTQPKPGPWTGTPDESAAPEHHLQAGAYLREATRQSIVRRVQAFVAAWASVMRRGDSPSR
jgi:hypothetical protein